ncbi:AAA family ATPase [Thalassoglobus sp. JC818]|uniref:AAA family ATPase n=1 Tax=Thalassoglobus sp. JC818 TaxID=3232136 RepID=UPI003457D0EB
MQMLKQIRLKGWKSIKDQTIDLTPLTVVIGANGAGKSNLLSLFRMLNAMFANTPGFRNYVGLNGFSDSLLHYGTKQTPIAEMELTFQTDTGDTVYFVRWAAASGGTLIFTDERVTFHRTGGTTPVVVELGAGHSESNLMKTADDGNQTARVCLHLLRSCRLFHFHDTSENSGARQPCYIEANRFLQPEAGNLAAMLYLFREKQPTAFRRITGTVRQMVPDFDGFVLEPSKLNEKQILLNWTHKGRDYEFGPHQLSDGSLRFIALATLLLQPSDNLPLLIALDEPELGLHPSALEVLSGMAQAASVNSQLLFATQSSILLDHFEPENVVVVNCSDGVSEFKRLNAADLEAWRADYTLGEIWEKNVIGGGPY